MLIGMCAGREQSKNKSKEGGEALHNCVSFKIVWQFRKVMTQACRGSRICASLDNHT